MLRIIHMIEKEGAELKTELTHAEIKIVVDSAIYTIVAHRRLVQISSLLLCIPLLCTQFAAYEREPSSGTITPVFHYK